MKKIRLDSDWMKSLIVILIILAVGIILSLYSVQYSFLEIPYLSTEGFSRVEVDADVKEHMVYLFRDCYRISMVTIEPQAFSIKTGLERIVDYRPTTHDLMRDMIKAFGMEVLMVKILIGNVTSKIIEER